MPKTEHGLTEKQERFCQEYIIDLNGTQALIRAGYSSDSAKEQASRLLTKDNIQARLKELKETVAERLGITQDYILNSFREVAERCLQKVPVLDSDGEPTGEWRFESSGANKALENLGKVIGVYEKDNSQKPQIPRTLIVKHVDSRSDDDNG